MNAATPAACEGFLDIWESPAPERKETDLLSEGSEGLHGLPLGNSRKEALLLKASVSSSSVLFA